VARLGLKGKKRAPPRVTSVSWLDLRDGDAAEVAGLLVHAGLSGFTIRYPDRSTLSVLSEDARNLRLLLDRHISISTFKHEGRLHVSHLEMLRCVEFGERRSDDGGLD
jgi:hypothetical protein